MLCADEVLATAQKMKLSIKDFFSKCDQIGKKLRIWSHLQKKSLIENFIFCAVTPSNVDGKRSPLKLFLVNILAMTSFIHT